MTDMPWLVAAFTALSLDAPGWNQMCLMPNAAASSTTASATFGGVMTEIQHTPSGSDLMDATAANPSTTSEVGFTGTAVYSCCGPEHGVSYWSCMRCNTARPTFMYARNTCCSANEGEPRTLQRDNGLSYHTLLPNFARLVEAPTTPTPHFFAAAKNAATAFIDAAI